MTSLPNPWLPDTFLLRAWYPDRFPPGMYNHGGPVEAYVATVGAEVDSMWETLAEANQELYPWRAQGYMLDAWEAQLLLLADPTLSTAQRQARILAQLGARFQVITTPEYARRVMGDTLAPTPIVLPGAWYVFKRTTHGWPGDEHFAGWQQQLQRHIGPIRAAIAPPAPETGLTAHQVDQLFTVAVDALTVAELDGP